MSEKKLEEHYEDEEDFEAILDDAYLNADSDWAEKFVHDVQDRYEQYGVMMFWSDVQDASLRKIAGEEYAQ